MAANISSVVAAAIGSRNWWDWWGDAAAIAVTAGVILESVSDFKFLARNTGLSTREELRERIAKFGLGLLIVALIAEVVVGRHVSAATDIIESNITTGMNLAAEANGRLDTRIKAQKHDLNTVTVDLATAQDQIDNLSIKEATLRKALNRLGPLVQQERELAERIVRGEKHQAAIEKETADFEDEILPRSFVIDAGIFQDLRPFADVPVFVSAFPDNDSKSFADSLKGILTSSGWHPKGLPPDELNLRRGVAIEYANPISDSQSSTAIDAVRLQINSRTVEAATALCKRLRENKIDATLISRSVVMTKNGIDARYRLWNDAVPLNAVFIRVGRKMDNNFVLNRELRKRGKGPMPGLNPEMAKMTEQYACGIP